MSVDSFYFSNIYIRSTFWLSSLLLGSVQAQVPATSFALPDTVCTNQSLALFNNTTGAVRYVWDFCSGSFVREAVTENLGVIAGSSIPHSSAVAFDGTNYYSFITSFGNGQLYRADFGDKLTNTPTITQLNLADSKLNGPIGIQMYKEGGNWYALICNFDNSLLRYRFGTSLTNVPGASDTEVLPVPAGLLNSPRELVIDRDNDQIKVLVTNGGNNQISVLNFGSSIGSNTITGANFSVPGSSLLYHLALVKDLNRWYGLCNGYFSNTVHKIDFGPSLTASPLSVNQVFNNVSTPSAISISQDRSQYYAHIATAAGGLVQLNFGSSMSNDTPMARSLVLPPLNDLRSLQLIKQSSGEVVGIGINMSSATLYRITFPGLCPASQPTSDQTSPVVSYSQPGKYYIDLTAYDANGSSRTVTDSVVVKSAVAPSAVFTTDDQCTQLATKFFGPAQDVDSWQWNFEDTNLPANSPDNLSTEQNPTHQYTTAGTYQVSLTVRSSNGCNNRITQAIIIYNNQKPQPAFSFPAQVCSFGEMPFTDQSVPASGDNVRNWRWNFGDGQTSAEQNPVHIYKQGGEFPVTLSVSGISGCDTTLTRTVSVLPGADVDFNYARVCIGDTLTFTNLTAPDGEWQWNFGDVGSTDNESTLKNPKHYYATSGDYTVRLSTKTANGCIVTRRKQVKVRTLPTVDFIYSQLCGNSPVTFTISAVSADTTVASLAWNFGDPSSPDNISTDESPTHTFTTGGTYNVQLTLTTSAGCQGSVSHVLTIAEPSIPNFTIPTACTSLPLAFTDTSLPAAGDAIVRWSWDFGDQTPVIRIRNPVHTFANPGNYTVKLTIEGGNSGCQNTVSKIVTVYPQPQVNFNTDLSCGNYSVRFTDASVITNDRIVAWEWNFGAEGTSQESNPTFQFNRTGTFAVSLKVTTANGCTASLSKAVTVVPLPEADFRFSPDFQPPPVQVTFTNDSRRAVRYEWNFGDNTAPSTDVAPRHTYETIGTYTVRLLAFGASGCADTLMKTVTVSARVVDAQVKSVLSTQVTGVYTIYAEIFNAGSVPLTALDLILQSGSSTELMEKWIGNLNPKQSFVYPFKVQLFRTNGDEFPYFCVDVRKPNNQEDARPIDNRSCTTPSGDFKVLPVYPNPFGAFLTLSYYSPESHPLEVVVFDSQGKRVKTYRIENTQTGYHKMILEAAGLSKGLYLLQMMYQGRMYGQRVEKID